MRTGRCDRYGDDMAHIWACMHAERFEGQSSVGPAYSRKLKPSITIKKECDCAD